MRILIVTAVFPPEPVVSAQIGRDLYDYLTGQGHQVTVLCPYPTRPYGAQYPKLSAHEQYEDAAGVSSRVVRLESFTAPKSQLLPRMLESFSFGRQVCRWLRRNAGQVDVVYANTWPLFSQAMVARYCARRNIPLVLHIQDIYPESLLCKLPRPIQGLIARPLRALDRWVAKSAASVVVISEGMRNVYTLDRHLDSAKVITIPNWSDSQPFENMPSRSKACSQYNVPESLFTFMFLGNIGKVAGVDYLIRAFHMASLPKAQLVIAGDGAAKADCIELAHRLGVENVRFISDPDATHTPLLLSMADVCMLPMRSGAGASSIPSKLLAYMLSGKPVLATVDADSDTARCINEADCGWVGEPENDEWLSMQMREVAARGRGETADYRLQTVDLRDGRRGGGGRDCRRKTEDGRLKTGDRGRNRLQTVDGRLLIRDMGQGTLEEIGQKGRAYALEHFSKAKGVQQLGTVIERQARIGASGLQEGANTARVGTVL